jgi:hypothetical protein
LRQQQLTSIKTYVQGHRRHEAAWHINACHDTMHPPAAVPCSCRVCQTLRWSCQCCRRQKQSAHWGSTAGPQHCWSDRCTRQTPGGRGGGGSSSNTCQHQWRLPGCNSSHQGDHRVEHSHVCTSSHCATDTRQHYGYHCEPPSKQQRGSTGQPLPPPKHTHLPAPSFLRLPHMYVLLAVTWWPAAAAAAARVSAVIRTIWV